jgi:transposase InsO family protein
MPNKKPPSDMALLRYQAISAFLVLDPPRGQRGAVLAELATKTWTLPDGRTRTFAAETLRGWIRHYRRSGMAGLEDTGRAQPGVGVLTDAQKDLICRLKRDVPSRSIERIIEVAEEMNLIDSGLLKRSTVHRVLRSRGLSGRKRAATSTKDLDRFEAEAPNDLWQSDMLAGPWLPDPDKPGKKRRAWLHAWLDDHSRLLLAGRWDFKQDLPTLEVAFREALRRCGRPRRVYYDNGKPYRSKHMAQIVAVLSNDKPIFTQPYRPEGHGKIEAFNRYCRAAFVDEVAASSITTLDELNQAFSAWRELKYNRRPHTEIGSSPWDRWRAGAAGIDIVDERELTEAFLFRKTRVTDKAGVLKLFGRRYQTGPQLAGKKVEVRYEPEDLELLEVWHGETFQERVKPLTVRPTRRPKQPETIEPSEAPLVDWLGAITKRHEPLPTVDAVAEARRQRQLVDDAMVTLVREQVDGRVFDETTVRQFLERYGPFEPESVRETLALVVELGGADQHLKAVLDAVLLSLGRVA